jgi:hypothetical protein
MGLRAAYGLGHSKFNDFLFGVVGQEKNGSELTLLSAFARLGCDPWKEAATLSHLSRQSAVKTLALTIARIPEGNWSSSDLPIIAERLLDRLPAHVAPAIPAKPAKRDREPAKLSTTTLWVNFLFAAAVFFIVSQWWGKTTPDPTPQSVSSTLRQSPP